MYICAVRTVGRRFRREIYAEGPFWRIGRI